MIESIHRAKFGRLDIAPKSNVRRLTAAQPLAVKARPIAESNVRQFNKVEYQREYMKAYRKRLKLCPHCGKEI